jgi:predicted GNAT superfamily acetyltransferase
MAICVSLQQAVWGGSDLDTVPDTIFVVAAKTGGQVIAAFDGQLPVGFVLAFPALRQGRAYLHSHMLAVLPQFRNHGVGRTLKLAQREDALARGIDLIEWTFDPLQLKNAHFNIARLGAISRRYIPDAYGRTSSPLHSGLPTDRLVAEWWLESPRVEGRLSGPTSNPTTDGEQIALPASIQDVCRSDPQGAEQMQFEFRRAFESYLERGYAAVGFKLNQDQGLYLMEPYED